MNGCFRFSCPLSFNLFQWSMLLQCISRWKDCGSVKLTEVKYKSFCISLILPWLMQGMLLGKTQNHPHLKLWFKFCLLVVEGDRIVRCQTVDNCNFIESKILLDQIWIPELAGAIVLNWLFFTFGEWRVEFHGLQNICLIFCWNLFEGKEIRSLLNSSFSSLLVFYNLL